MARDCLFTKYPALAKNIIEEGWVGRNVFGDNPLYIYFHAAASSLFKSQAIAAAQIIQFVLGSLSCVLTYYIARRLFDKKAGIIAAIIQASYGMLIVYEGSLVPVSLTIFLNAAAILFLLKFQEGRKLRHLFIAGLFLGISAANNPNILLFAIFCLLWMLFEFRKTALKALILYLLFFSFTVVLPLVPIGIRNYVVGRDIVPVTASFGVVFYSGNNPEASGALSAPPKEVLPILDRELMGESKAADITVEHKAYRDIVASSLGKELKPSQVSKYWLNKALEFIGRHPWLYLRLELRRLFFTLNSYEIPDTSDVYINYVLSSGLPFFTFGIIFSLGLLGIIFFREGRKKAALVYLILLSYFLCSLIIAVHARYRLPAVPFLIIFASYALVYGHKLLTTGRRKSFFFFVSLFFIFFTFSTYENSSIKDLQRHQFAYYMFFNPATNFYRQGQYLKAEEYFKKAVRLSPQLYPRAQRFMLKMQQQK